MLHSKLDIEAKLGSEKLTFETERRLTFSNLSRQEVRTCETYLPRKSQKTRESSEAFLQSLERFAAKG